MKSFRKFFLFCSFSKRICKELRGWKIGSSTFQCFFGKVSGLSIAKVNSGNAEATRRPPTRGSYSILRNPFIAQALLLLMQPTNSSRYLVLHLLYLSLSFSLCLALHFDSCIPFGSATRARSWLSILFHRLPTFSLF